MFCARSERNSGPMATAPAQVDLGTPSESLASQSRRRGPDLEIAFHVTRVIKLYSCKQNTELHRQSWKQLALVQQSGILHEPGKELRVRAVERLPFCARGGVPEHEAALGAICEPLLDGQITDQHSSHHVRSRGRASRLMFRVKIACHMQQEKALSTRVATHQGRPPLAKPTISTCAT